MDGDELATLERARPPELCEQPPPPIEEQLSTLEKARARARNDAELLAYMTGAESPPTLRERCVRTLRCAAPSFDAESRAVRFTTARVLYDVGLSAPLAWRKEGDASASAVLEEAEGSPVPAATGAADGSDDNIYDSQDGDDESDDDGLQLGAAVKARSQGGDAWVAGSIAALNGDGTVDVLYEHSHTLEQGVPREFVQLVDGVAASEPEGAAVADTIDSFFEMFVSALTSGALFQKMTPEQQAVASEKVRGLRPHFEAELTTLKEARGIGASVSGDDIRELLPRVMARAKAPPAPAPTQTASAEVA